MMTDNQFLGVAAWSIMVFGLGMAAALADWSALAGRSVPNAELGIWALVITASGAFALWTWWATQGALKRQIKHVEASGE